MNEYEQEMLSSYGDGVYAAEKLIDRRKRKNGKTEYLVKWRGWSSQHNTWEPESNILDHRLIEEFDRTRVKIKCEPESKSTSVAGRSLRKTPARASANSAQSQEERIKSEPNDEYEDLNKPLYISTGLVDSSSPSGLNSMSTERLSSPSSPTRNTENGNFQIPLEDRSGPSKQAQNRPDNKIASKEKLMNFYKNEYQNNHQNEISYRDEAARDEYRGRVREEYQEDIGEQDEIGYRSEDSDEQEEVRSEGDGYSSYSPSSSQDSQNDDNLNPNERLNQFERQQTGKIQQNATSNWNNRGVPVRETNNVTTNTVAKSSKMVANHNPPIIKSSNQKPKLTISSLKCTDHVRNNLTNLNYLSPTTLKITLKNKNFAANGAEDASRLSSFGRMNLARSQPQQPSSFNQNNEKMVTCTNSQTSNSSSSSDVDSLDNSLESQSDEDQTANSRKIWRPKFFKDRMEFAHQVVITSIRDRDSIITFKESRKTFPKFPNF